MFRVSHYGLTCGGGQFGQNGQKLHGIYKINILGAKQWRGNGGNPPFPSPPTKENLMFQLQFLLGQLLVCNLI